MRTLTQEVYTYDELDEKAQEKARDWYREGDSDNFWTEYIYDEAVEQGALMGIDIATRGVPLHGGGTRDKPCIWWSGFWSQGDGACFDGTWRAWEVGTDKVADGWGDAPETTELKRIAAGFAEVAKDFPTAYFHVKQSGHYYHKYCTDFDFGIDEPDTDAPCLEKYKTAEDDPEETVQLARDRYCEDFGGAEKWLMELARDFMDWIYGRLENEYDYQNSDENVAENIRANDYEFTKAGNRSITI